MINETLQYPQTLFYGIFPTESHETFLYVSGETRKETIIKSKRAGFEINDNKNFVIFNDNEFYRFSKTHQMLRVTVHDKPQFYPQQIITRNDGAVVDQPELTRDYEVEEEEEQEFEKKVDTKEKLDSLMGRLSKSMNVKTPVYHKPRGNK